MANMDILEHCLAKEPTERGKILFSVSAQKKYVFLQVGLRYNLRHHFLATRSVKNVKIKPSLWRMREK